MAEPANGVFRKSAFGGFNKSDVLVYLDRVSAQHEQERSELGEHIGKLESINRQLNEELGSCKSQIETLSGRLEEEQGRLSEAEQSASHMLLRLTEQMEQTEARERDLQIQTELCRQLREQIGEYEERVRKYEEISAKIDCTLRDAKENAEQIVSEAERRASSIVGDAEQKASAVRGELGSFREEIDGLRKLVRTALGEVEEKLTHIDAVAAREQNGQAAPRQEKPQTPAPVSRVVVYRKSLIDSTFDALENLRNRWFRPAGR